MPHASHPHIFVVRLQQVFANTEVETGDSTKYRENVVIVIKQMECQVQ